jgi:hypothetical protein
MGAKQSTFLYSPLEYVSWKEKYPSENLESYLIWRLEGLFGTKISGDIQLGVKSMNHKIRCLSEGWQVQPKILFDFVKLDDGAIVARVLKISEAV